MEKTAAEPVPLHIRNAVTKLMKQVGYGKGYQYAHDLDEKVADMECMPDNLRGREYYHPTQEGREKLLAQRMEEIKQRKEELRRAEAESTKKNQNLRNAEEKRKRRRGDHSCSAAETLSRTLAPDAFSRAGVKTRLE